MRIPVLDATEEERAHGFAPTEMPSGKTVLALCVAAGELYAVKMKSLATGTIEYVICGADLVPVYSPVASLAELVERFR